MTPEEFRAAAHVLVDWIADHRTRIAGLPVRSTVAPGAVATALGAEPPGSTRDIASLIAELDRTIVPGITQVQHPRNFAWFPSNASLASVLGDMASSGLGALGITWQAAPALTEVEEVVTDWLRQLTGLSEQWHGTIHDTASTAALVAMLAARERATGHGSERGGLQQAPAPLTVYASPQAHSSVAKAVLLAGYGRENLREIATDPKTYALDPAALDAAIRADLAAGLRPAAIVASIGSTGTTAVDPLADIVPIARAHGLWLHVDAAMAGSALLLPEYRWLVEGLDGANSLSWNPHKWMGTILDCSLFYVRNPAELVRVLSTDPSYLRSAVDGAVIQYKDWGIPLGRRFRALKLWFHLHLDGVEAIRARLRRDLANARWLTDQVEQTSGWRLLAPVPLQTLCLRHEPPGLVGPDGTMLDGSALDAHTLAWVEAVNATGEAFLTPITLDGRWVARISIGAEPTEQADVEALWRIVRREAERLAAPAGATTD